MNEVWKSAHRHSRSIDADFGRVAAKLHETRGKGLAARQDKWQRRQESTQPMVVPGLFVSQHDVHAMKRNQRGSGPVSHERKQVDTCVTKVDVEELSVATRQDPFELIILSAIEDRLHPLEVFPLKAQEKVDPRTGKNFDVRKWECVGVFPRLGHDEGLKLAQSSDLPVDMLHLPLQESIAIASNDGLMHEESSKSSLEVFASGFSEPSGDFRGLMRGELRFRRRRILAAG